MATRKTAATQTAVISNRTQDYEMVVIISPDVNEEELEATLASINQYITSKEGVISEVDQWGKKRLAYPVEHFLEGNYVLMRFQMNPARCRELEANLKISEAVIRHLLIKLGD